MDGLRYSNPVLHANFSDPDVIRDGRYFYMVSSSFNFVPGIPVLRSENLVEWELVNYVVKRLPFPRFDGRVCRGEGVWAPSLRRHGGKFFCVVPVYDDGIYVSEADSMEGEWSPLRPLIRKSGIIDPCPIWERDRCYLAVAFARSRIGFNSAIGLYEVSPGLTECVSDGYKIIYDGRNDNPVIEGPKFYKRGKYFYILAPAGSVKSGWQVALRSENIYGPYESKIILMQGDTFVNGPHQGALVDAPDGRDWFLHFQDMRAYGRIVHLQPVEWRDGWPICGDVKYDGIAGTPAEGGDYPVPVKTRARLPARDGFKKGASPIWQTPANPVEKWREEGEGGLKLFCLPSAERIELYPYAMTAMVRGREFTAECNFCLNPAAAGDEVGFGITGRTSAFLSVVYTDKGYEMRFVVSDGDGEEIILKKPLASGELNVRITGRNQDIYRLMCSFDVCGKPLPYDFEASTGVWVGARFVLFARNGSVAKSGGYALIKEFSLNGKP